MDDRDRAALATEVLALGRAAGLDAVGIAAGEPFVGTRQIIEERKAAGLHGGMQFTYRQPARSTDPSATVPGAAALVVGARRYLRADPVPDAADRITGSSPPAPGGRPLGTVARYSWSDHYLPLREALGAMADHLVARGWRARTVADDNALVDREAAYRAGLGWYGKNANLLIPGRGSWFVLGAVITDAPLPAAEAPAPDGCGSCRRCLPACPTGALVAPGVLDARRCLAWLVQAPGIFPAEHRVALGARIYGCDDCQEVCPVNERGARSEPPAPRDASDEATVDLLELLAGDDDALLARHRRWYIAERAPRHLRRNALLALGNVADGRDPAVVQAVERALRDGDGLVRAHAVWAAARLGRTDLLDALRGDPDPDVQVELARAAEVPTSDVAGTPGR